MYFGVGVRRLAGVARHNCLQSGQRDASVAWSVRVLTATCSVFVESSRHVAQRVSIRGSWYRVSA